MKAERRRHAVVDQVAVVLMMVIVLVDGAAAADAGHLHLADQLSVHCVAPATPAHAAPTLPCLVVTHSAAAVVVVTHSAAAVAVTHYVAAAAQFDVTR